MPRFRNALLCLALALAAGVACAEELTLEQAMEKVQQETKGNVLATDTLHYGRTTVYSIKVLTPDGRVKVVRVKAQVEKNDKGEGKNDKGDKEKR